MTLQAPEVVVFDLETTGLSAAQGGIVEIGAVVVSGLAVTDDVFHTLVNPGRAIPWSATRIHGITNEMVTSAPTERVALTAFFEWLSGRALVAHNAPFDLSFVQCGAARAGLTAPRSAICTVRLSRRLLLGGRHNLDEVCARLGVTTQDRHRALGDTLATAEVFVRLRAILLERETQLRQPSVDTFSDWTE